MRLLASRLAIAVALISTALLLRGEARQLRQRADTHERFATLRFDIAALEQPGYLESLMSSVDSDSADRAVLDRASAAYWQARYDALTTGVEDVANDPDPEVLLLMANAAFRAAQRAGQQPRPAQVQQLDLVIQAYASALESPVFLPDAAYNYEYVVRARDALARPRGPAAAASLKPQAARGGDLPAGPTIHGRPGGPPPSTKGEEFEILTPMEYGDREAQPEATPGVKPLRKG